MKFRDAPPTCSTAWRTWRADRYAVEIIRNLNGQREVIVWDDADHPTSTVGATF